MDLTDNQLKAIELRNKDILVSAAAGSGKTSVLVDRIIRRICDDSPRIDVDRLLIMTFTNAAAAEMKERIRNAIDDRLDKAQGDIENLEKQSVLVHNAKITTIHGFCQSIIRDHFEEIGIDPNFRVGDENECKLMKIDAVAECLEEAYSEGNPGFLRAVECFSGNKNDEELSELVLKLHNFSMASPDPAGFLEMCKKAYCADSLEEFGGLDCVRGFMQIKAEKLNELLQYAEHALSIIDATPVIEGYRITINDFKTCAERALAGLADGKYDDAGVILRSLNPTRMKSIGDKGLADDEIAARDCVKSIKDILKKGLDKLAGEFDASYEENFRRMNACRPEVEALCNLVTRFGEVYSAQKREKNIIDFNDMEHMALTILSQNREIAGIYRDFFEEIYVDEYQDSNLTQETLVNLIKRDEGNVFTVGDVKQSIYRFRMARPDLFIEKYEKYTDEDSQQQRVLLNDNFRSRREVVNAVNEVFSVIMKKDFGKIEYDESAMLRYGATYYDKCAVGEDETQSSAENAGVKSFETNGYKAELVLGCPDELPSPEFQANAIANRINAMIKGKMQVYDKGSNSLRDVKFRDFVILVRSLKGWEAPIRDILMNAGIPVSVTGSEGYFATTEVQTALAFLSIVDNPYQDIPFATVMRSPVGGFSDVEMGIVAAVVVDKEAGICGRSIFAKLKTVSAGGNTDVIENTGNAGNTENTVNLNPQLRHKSERLIKLISEYRELSTYTQVSELLRKFIDEEYGDYVRVMNKGAQRMANLNMLLSKAEDFGRTSFTGLYHFMRYMDQIRKYEMDYGEAGVLGEADDVVRIMTIHKSKGLEFPVCFVAGCEKSRNATDERKGVVWDVSFGLGCDFTDVERRVKKPTIVKSLIKEQLFRENLAEEMRVLYVAMTRAREKLIMVGTYKKDNPLEKIPAGIANCSSFLDMLTLAVSQTSPNFDITYETEETLLAGRLAGEVSNESGRETVLKILRDCIDTDSSAKRTSDNCRAGERNDDFFGKDDIDKLSFVYPYADIPNMSQKLSVSDLKHRAIEEKRAAGEELVPDGQVLYKETEPDKYIPKFMRQDGQTQKGGTFYGTAFHRILELWEYSVSDVQPSDVSDFAKRMLDKNRLDKDQADAINANDIAFFLNSSLGKRMKAAKDKGLLYREQPFVLGMKAQEVYPEYYGTEDGTGIVSNPKIVGDNSESFGGTPEILIQGIIDAYFVEDDEITIVDYKTDSVTNAQMLINRYKPQLEYYGRALSQITGKKIKALTIYSSRLREEIVVG